MSPASPRALRLYVAAWSLAALVATVVAAATVLRDSDVPWVTVGLLLVAMIVADLLEVRTRVGPTMEASTFMEIAAVPTMLLVDPPVAILVTLVAALVSESVLTRSLLKHLYNVGWQVVAMTVGAVTYSLLAGGASFAGTAPQVAAALVASAVFVLVNHLAFSGLLSILSGRRVTTIALEELPGSTRDNYGAAVIGVLIGLLLEHVAIAVPLVVLLGIMLRQRQLARSDGYERLAAERDRLDRTVAGSSDGVALLDSTGRVEVWNPAMEAITGIPAHRAVGAALPDLGLDLGLERLLGAGTGSEDELRVDLGQRVLAVRRAVVGTGHHSSTVVTVRDVSREAELGRIREDLVSRVSHELRTPLTSLEGFLEVLSHHWDELGDDGRRELLQASRRGSRRLSRLVTNLMVWARIESRTSSILLAGDPVDPLVVLRQVLEEHEIADLRLEVDDGVAVAVGEDDLHTVLTNLLSNAVLYGAAPVAISMRPVGDHVEVVVADAGPGLPAEFRDQMFEPFAQASDGIQRTAKGLGMGLAIVRSVVTSYGGTIRHDDEPAGGTRFTVTLPTTTPSVPAAAEVGLYDASDTSSSSR